MRIAHVMLGRGFGGIERLFCDTCLELAARNQTVLVLIRKGYWYTATELESQENIEVVYLTHRFGAYDKFIVRQIRNAFNYFNPEVIVTHGSRPTLFCGKVKNEVNCPIVATIGGRLKWKYTKNADILLPATKKQSELEYHKDLVDAIFAEPIPHFSRCKPVSHISKRKAIKNLVAVGRFNHSKGMDILIRAFHKLISNGFDLSLTIAGDGPDFKDVKSLSNKLNLTGSVTFLGYQSYIQELLKQADLFVLPSRSESFGLVLLEAMSAGISIVATKTNGPLEIFDKQTAILVEKDSVDSLAEGISVAIQDPQGTNLRARNALQLFKSKYSSDVVVPQLLSLYRNLAQNYQKDKSVI